MKAPFSFACAALISCGGLFTGCTVNVDEPVDKVEVDAPRPNVDVDVDVKPKPNP